MVLALGVRGGVPPKAADVPLEQHLRGTFPEMALQVSQPAALLLPSKRRPKRVKRSYTWAAHSYPELVKRNVKAGLHCWKRSDQVANHRGALCLAGAFAVRKDEVEDRVITDPSVNQLIDPDKLPRPRFAYIPKLRTVTVPAGGLVVVSKGDARHDFHRLKIGRLWRRCLCGPPVRLGRSSGRVDVLHPASCSAPIGFGPSAGWAQALSRIQSRKRRGSLRIIDYIRTMLLQKVCLYGVQLLTMFGPSNMPLIRWRLALGRHGWMPPRMRGSITAWSPT